MNLLLLVVLVSILLLILGNRERKAPPPLIPKEDGYKTLVDYSLDAPSVYGAFVN